MSSRGVINSKSRAEVDEVAALPGDARSLVTFCWCWHSSALILITLTGPQTDIIRSYLASRAAVPLLFASFAFDTNDEVHTRYGGVVRVALACLGALHCFPGYSPTFLNSARPNRLQHITTSAISVTVPSTAGRPVVVEALLLRSPHSRHSRALCPVPRRRYAYTLAYLAFPPFLC